MNIISLRFLLLYINKTLFRKCTLSILWHFVSTKFITFPYIHTDMLTTNNEKNPASISVLLSAWSYKLAVVWWVMFQITKNMWKTNVISYNNFDVRKTTHSTRRKIYTFLFYYFPNVRSLTLHTFALCNIQ